MHNYGFDLNNLVYKANEQYNGLVESYALQLDGMLFEQELTPELENFVEKTIEFLYGVLEEESNEAEIFC